MTFIPFELERWQSTWENRVRHNISESGVHPLSIRELLDLAGAKVDEFTDLRMIYNQANGTDELRRAIAALYAGNPAGCGVVGPARPRVGGISPRGSDAPRAATVTRIACSGVFRAP